MMRYFKKKEGNIFCIPLFLPNDPKKPFKSYAKSKFYLNMEYSFGRLIEIDKDDKTLYLVEVFKYSGEVPDDKEVILNSKRLFPPVFVIEPFENKRWRFVFEADTYDKYKDSDYENITFFMAPYEKPIMWKGGAISWKYFSGGI